MANKNRLNELKKEKARIKKQINRLNKVSEKKLKEEHFGDLYVDDAILYVPGAATALIGSFAYDTFTNLALPDEKDKYRNKIATGVESAVLGSIVVVVYLPLIALFGTAEAVIAVPHAAKTGVKSIIRNRRNARIKKAPKKAKELQDKLEKVEQEIQKEEKKLQEQDLGASK